MMKCPQVIGEILSGIILGPSILGFIKPEVYQNIFSNFKGQDQVLSLFYWTGLILLMFCSGFKIKNKVNIQDRKIILYLLISSTILPFIGSYIYTKCYDFTSYQGINANNLNLYLLVATAVSVTSIPVISRIFIDINIIKSHFAKIVIFTATIQDIFLWVILSFVTKEITNSQTPIISTAIFTIFFITFFLTIGVKIFNKIKFDSFLKIPSTIYILTICFIICAISYSLGMNLIFGALIAGIIVGNFREKKFIEAKKNINKIALSFFIPVYFSIVGLKINMSLHFDYAFFLSFISISTLLEFSCIFLTLLLLKQTLLTSFNFSVAMNTRGGPGIVLACVALDYKIINETFFVTLVLSAILTSFLSGLWFNYCVNKKLVLYDKYNEVNKLLKNKRSIKI